MDINMEVLQNNIYIPFSNSFFRDDYYKSGNGAGYWNGGDNDFYKLYICISEYSPEYDVNCLFTKTKQL